MRASELILHGLAFFSAHSFVVLAWRLQQRDILRPGIHGILVVWSQGLFLDVQRMLVERFGLFIHALFGREISKISE